MEYWNQMLHLFWILAFQFFFQQNFQNISQIQSNCDKCFSVTFAFSISVNILHVKSNRCLVGFNLQLYLCGTFWRSGISYLPGTKPGMKTLSEGKCPILIALLRGDLGVTGAELWTIYISWCVQSEHANPHYLILLKQRFLVILIWACINLHISFKMR